MTGRITVFNAHGRLRMPKGPLARSARTVLKSEGREKASVSVILIDGRRSGELNRRFLGHRGPTDVISFALEGGENPEGEIYVNLDRARVQAAEYDVTLSNEVARLVVHGALHLAGYDDRKSADARRMRERENRYMRRLFPAEEHERNS